jgi:malonyl-CoA O-methyltransferase
MAMQPEERSAPRPLDGRALQRQRRRLLAAPTAPWLHQEVARRMAERIGLVRRAPRCIVDWWARLGGGGEALRQACPNTRRIEAESDAGALNAPRERTGWWTRLRGAAPSTERVDAASLPEGGADLLWSNMGLHLAPDPQRLMRIWQRATAVDGFVLFSTLGPGTLVELVELHRQQGWGAPLAPFVDMHDLGDMLVEAGFAEPVMDQETITLTWRDADALLTELRSLGGNAARERFAGLRNPRWRQQLKAALQARAAADGRIALTFEVVYGHAFKPTPRARVAGETAVPLDDLRAMVRAGRPRPG